ncbi:MAG: OmpA family protein [bacterium]|nr:OmpA family protein [bacterium]
MTTSKMILVALAMALAIGLAAGARAADEIGPAAEVKSLLDRAKDLGAKGQLPTAWWDLDKRYKAAREGAAGAATWDLLRRDARGLVNRAAFIKEMRERKSGMEALLGRFDQALAEIAALHGLETAPSLTGSAAAADLMTRLDALNFGRQARIDSLTVANRHLTDTVGGRFAVQESTITALQVQVSSLRRQVWETELRAGVAEADRSAAESVLSRRQQRADAVAAIQADFGPEKAEVSLTPAGAVVLQVFGLEFGVGSAEVRGGQDTLLDQIVAAVERFPGAQVAVEGHTDDTGTREANLRLSRRRAETVANLLAGRLDWGVGEIVATGHGPDRPVALNATPEGRARNRRIDVVITPVQ